MQIGRKELMWSWSAQILSVVSGIVVLPAVLQCLSAEEIGFNYILLSVGSLVTLVNFGFTPQFSRTVTFVYSGARRLLKEGVDTGGLMEVGDMDLRLLKKVVATAKWIYMLFGLVALGLMGVLGTPYVYHVTQGFQAVPHAAVIWLLYAVCVAFSLYADCYGVFLFGSGQVVKRYQVVVISQVFVMVFSYVALYAGFGLLGRVTVLLCAAVIQWAVSRALYMTKSLKRQLAVYKVRFQEKKELFGILWFNARRGGLCKLSEMVTSQGVIMVAGAFLSLAEVASFGLMQQLFLIAGNVANITFLTYQPQMAYWMARGKRRQVAVNMAGNMQIFYLLFIVFSGMIIWVAPPVFAWIGSNSQLPAAGLVAAYAFVRLCEYNYQDFNQYYICANRYPFVTSLWVSGVAVVALAYVFTAWLPWGIWGLVSALAVGKLSWVDWYWPRRVLREMGMGYGHFLSVGHAELRRRFSRGVRPAGRAGRWFGHGAWR